jgi:hypothetical protein
MVTIRYPLYTLRVRAAPGYVKGDIPLRGSAPTYCPRPAIYRKGPLGPSFALTD